MEPRGVPTSNQPGVPNEPTSRRKFLKAAVVGGAAVAAGAASGAAGIALASKSSPVPRILTSFNGGGSLSGRQQFKMCVTDSGYKQLPTVNGYPTLYVHGGQETPGTLFLWFTAHDLAPSTTVGYVLDITVDAIGGDPTGSSTPFELQSSGNNAFLFQLGDWAASDCPTGCPIIVKGNCSPNRSAKTEAKLYLDSHGNPNPYTFGGSVHQDLQQYVHVVWDGGQPTTSKTYSFSATVKTGNGTLLGTGSFTINVVPN